MTTGAVASSPPGRVSGRADASPAQLHASPDDASAVLVVDDDPDCGELVSRAVSLSQEAVRQQRQLAQIFHSTSDGIILVGEGGRVLRGNRRAGELLGVDFEQAVDRPLAQLLDGASSDPSDAHGVRALLALLDAPGEHAHGELELARTRRALRWSGQPVLDGDRLVGLTLTFQDVTREREVSRMKSDFVSFVAHQLRTPLSGIKWMLELAGGEADVPSMVASCVRDASASADRLIGMVNELLDIARLESGSLVIALTAVDLGALTAGVLADLRSSIHDKRLQVTVEADEGMTPVLADPQLLRQVVLNLISNAVKYTPPGGAVAVRMREDGAMVDWQVADSGIGIPAEAQEHVFEKFYRADNAAIVETEGTGLGLYLARLIVHRLEGRIWFTSEEGAGATFGIALSRARHP